MQCTINDLPDELLEYILSLIPPYRYLEECKFVSKRWYQATKNVLKYNKTNFQRSAGLGSLICNPWDYDSDDTVISKRFFHSTCLYENSMYVFGGCTSTFCTYNDLWRLDLDNRTWNRVITMGSYPSPKAGATMLCYKKSLILFGGWSYPSENPLQQRWIHFNELHEYSIENNKWTAINTLVTPPPLSIHSASIHKNMMIVFGGINTRAKSKDIWCLNLDTYTWYKKRILGNTPESRYSQSQIAIGDNHLLIIGGCIGSDFAIDDAWLLNMGHSIWTWTKVNINKEFAPKEIWCRQACKVGDYVVVLSKHKCPNIKHDASTSIPAVKRSVQIADSIRTSNQPFFRTDEKQKSSSLMDKEENVNGRHGSFLRSSLQNKSQLHKPLTVAMHLPEDNNLSLAAFREKPFDHLVDRYRRKFILYQMRSELGKKQTRRTSRVRQLGNTLSIFVLDISNVLSGSCSATWIPMKRNDSFEPEERILYSLVAGRGELILFGGVRKEDWYTLGRLHSNHLHNPGVYNDLTFITPPQYVV